MVHCVYVNKGKSIRFVCHLELFSIHEKFQIYFLQSGMCESSLMFLHKSPKPVAWESLMQVIRLYDKTEVAHLCVCVLGEMGGMSQKG